MQLWSWVKRGLFMLTATGLVAACNDNGASSTTKASLSLEISDISFEEKNGRQQFNHTRIFVEKNGVDLTITRGKICVESRKTCVDALVDYKVAGKTTLVQENHHVATRQGEDAITFEYWAKDENGFDHKLSKTMLVDGQTAVVKQ